MIKPVYSRRGYTNQKTRSMKDFSSTKVVAPWTPRHSKHKQASEIYKHIQQMINSSMSSLSNHPSALDSNYLSIPFQAFADSDKAGERLSSSPSFPAFRLNLLDRWILCSGRKLRWEFLDHSWVGVVVSNRFCCGSNDQ